MRRFMATFLIGVMVFSLMGPYYARAEGNTTDSNQVKLENENLLLEGEISNQNRVDLENVPEGKKVKEGITDQPDDSLNIEGKVEYIEDEKQKGNESNDVNSEQIVEESVNIQDTTLNTDLGQKIEEFSVSKLGKIKSTTAKIFKDLNDSSNFFMAGTSYTNSVYYIKKQAVTDDQTYYLISNKPSSVNGIVGWLKASEIITYEHKTVDNNRKMFFIKGDGSAYSKAWGGSKDLVYSNLSSYKHYVFNVNLTEKVGNNTWYRGTLAGKTAWIHSSHLSEKVESNTSRLGQLLDSKVKIYKTIGDSATAISAGSKYINSVYFIKKQAKIGEDIYYLISNQPSSVKGVIGWVHTSDMKSYTHAGVDKNTKIFTIRGIGKAYSKAWGGSKDIVYPTLSGYKNSAFTVNLTEKVGNNIWYRGTLGGKTVWIHSTHLMEKVESNTSRLGQLLDSNVKIYKEAGDSASAFAAGTKYLNTVYFIKKQVKVDGQIYYLISTKPSQVNGVIGWVHTSDMKSYTHVGVDKKAKTLYIKGNGKAYSKAWGGSKDLVYSNLSSYKHYAFNVNLTEKVGNNTWYRGTLAGKTVWIHSSHLAEKVESNTSRLGQLLDSKVKIYKTIGDSASAISAGSKYMNSVYFIKKQAKIGEDIYYLISNQPSSVKGVIGWVHASDMKSYTHAGVDKNTKTLYLKGTGKAYNKAWGGSKDLVYSTLSDYKNSKFTVNLTEKVGNNTWYRGILNGKTVWIHEAYVHEGSVVLKTYTDYDLSLDSMLEIQMKVSPQTDKGYKLWIREDAFGSIANGKGTIKGDKWNLRRGPGTNYMADGQVNNGTVLTIYNEETGTDGRKWYHVRNTSGWVLANPEDVTYYLTPANFTGNLKDSLQFVKLSESANLNVNEVNEKILAGKGVLAGKAQAFIDGGKANGVNEIYLIAHALLETGHGASQLANGVEVGRDSQGKLVLVNDSNRNSLKDIKKTYNMYGINAIDSAPLHGGATYAYEKGWFTPEAAIKGGAAFIGNGYVNKGQDTLYKMRWNPLFASLNNYASHQYATDIGWAYKQTSKMYELYQLLDEYHIVLDIPRYK